jgi:2-dehydro-3-deoxygalactonokinase
MKLFFSCDWGTSAFRLRLVNAENGKILSEIKTDQGIAVTFNSWKQLGKKENNRIIFYQGYLFEQVKKIATSFKEPGNNVPIVLSGMASSSIGMTELPYKELPFSADGSDLIVHTIENSDERKYKIIIISGARSEVDVMRGEETILAGCDISKNETEQLFIFPGTHSKHITVKNGFVKSITTYMTGELFDLLSNKSILSASVKKNDLQQDISLQHFADGVIEGISSNILSSLFHVRTNQLFDNVKAEQNYHYLSGLLIGHELKDVAENKSIAITLVCSEGLRLAYTEALSILKLSDQLHYKNADDALIKGQRMIIDRLGY